MAWTEEDNVMSLLRIANSNVSRYVGVKDELHQLKHNPDGWSRKMTVEQRNAKMLALGIALETFRREALDAADAFYVAYGNSTLGAKHED